MMLEDEITEKRGSPLDLSRGWIARRPSEGDNSLHTH